MTELEYLCNLKDKKTDRILTLYKVRNHFIIKEDSHTKIYINGVTIEDDYIQTKIIFNDRYIYLPSIKYTLEDLIKCIICRDKYIDSINITKKVRLKKNLKSVDPDNLIILNNNREISCVT